MYWAGCVSDSAAWLLLCVVVLLQTLLPLTPTGELCDLEGNCVDAAEDEIFKLTTQVSTQSSSLDWYFSLRAAVITRQQYSNSDGWRLLSDLQTSSEQQLSTACVRGFVQCLSAAPKPAALSL